MSEWEGGGNSKAKIVRKGQAAFGVNVRSTNVESENNWDVCATRCWMWRGHRRIEGEKGRTIERNRKRPRGTSRRKTNNRINCFFKEGYNGSEGLSRCGIAINSSSGNATGQVVERVVRERARGRRRRWFREREKKRDVCRYG